MSSYQITVGGQFNEGYEYPLNLVADVTPATDPLKRAFTVTDAAEEIIFERRTLDCTVIVYNRGANHARVRFYKSGDFAVDLSVPPGRLIALASAAFSVDEDSSAFAAYQNWEIIAAQSVSGDTQIEVLVIEEEIVS